ncbi:MAG: radical SAM protein [Planctomycetota bacterium]
MKLSKYTLFYDNYNSQGDALAYNTRTQGVLGVNKQAREFIGNICQLDQQTSRPADLQTALGILADSGIIVDDRIDEDQALEGWFEEIKFRARPLHATVLTTFKCNFACAYCFEQGVRDERTMSDQTADEVIEFLKRKAIEKNSQKVRLMFYGGEPLMNPKAIIRIATALKQWAAERGIKFSFGMITNGSLVKKDIIEQLAKLGLTSIRITLDGDKETHDKRRPFADGRGSFENIVANVFPVSDIVKLELGANFDQDNLAGLHRLLDYLEQKNLNKRIARVLFAPVVSRLGGDLKESRRGAQVGCTKLSGELAEQGIKLEKELIQRGYNTPSSVQVNACPMTMDDSMLVIDPMGGIYKCEAFAGREQFRVGNVREPRFNSRYDEFLALKPWKECLDCPYVPMCGGGCRYIARLKHGDYTKRACDKEYYEKIFPQLLKMDYERGAL